MFAQKTTELIRRIRRFRSIGYSVLVVNFVGDDRYGQGLNEITTHDQDKQEAVKVSKLEQVDGIVRNGMIKVIVIDEGQFFPDLVKYVSEWVDSFGLQVVVAGLSGDSERRPFGDILRLVPLADEFVQLTALCSLCKNGTVAQFSKYLGADVKNENQIAVGGLDRYVPVCRRHFS
jgi:thymidine kinase